MINQKIASDTDSLCHEFTNASPFKHISIDNFLEDDYINNLCKDFPKFDNSKALNEYGQPTHKCTNPDIKTISPFYKQFYDYISSREFLSVIEKISGIDNLVMDDRMYGGGTHENIDGAELDIHVDFNYDTATGFHRRLNLLLYLNEDWDESWGGAIELFANPVAYSNQNNISKTFNCIKNRCVIFETNEHSWHGFKKINIPKDKGSLSRKLISIYLYTEDRPKDEIAANHGTFYFPYAPKLPESIEFDDARRLISKRDMLLMNAYKKQVFLAQQIETLHKNIALISKRIKPNYEGDGTILEAEGYYHDKWIAQQCIIDFVCSKDIDTISFYFMNPQNHRGFVKISINDCEPIKFLIKDKIIKIKVSTESVSLLEKNTFTLISDIDSSVPTDGRNLSLMLDKISFKS